MMKVTLEATPEVMKNASRSYHKNQKEWLYHLMCLLFANAKPQSYQLWRRWACGGAEVVYCGGKKERGGGGLYLMMLLELHRRRCCAAKQ